MVICAAATISGCLFKKDKEITSDAQQYYDKAKMALNNKNYQTSISYYETLEARYPFSKQARQGQLDLIFAYYSNHEPESVIDAARQFERENPSHPRVDYAIYMRGRAQFSGEKSAFHRLFNVNLSKRPPKDARNSYSAFAELIRRFPESRYAPDARQRMIFLRNRVAEHENHIASYYYQRGAYAAALSRANYAVKVFDGAPTTSNSLIIMVDSYRKLGMYDLADDAEAVLIKSFPDARLPVPVNEEEPWYKFW
ncbi:MAG: outer membrane protein assembly factor BamD [Gammaproteobacteria bacterium]|nr:outer membrane protein assembly factor BamD [Gammaproteobacteria bacterium]MCP4088630.1 outer membrane protein assembly factor BamD [Gammaproteobacteria bacterium]MCP4832339.1 outer membrane protein assembly factor BamD [Gammaproteobacteria bacterium]MCP4929147.1 outer membrane protein assembly factor BamD [Gammaproteobacteria bacterium]